MNITLEPKILSGNDVLTVENLSKAFTDTPLFTDLNFNIKRGERVALIGNNGTGKTTILKLINGIIPLDGGEITLGAKVMVGYYDQEHNVLNPENTLFEEIADAYPDLTNTKIRNTLAAFLFTDDDVFKLIKDLSGGEKGRVSLAKLMLSDANFLILDEPTNHLDITSKEILENALNNYTGTVLYVSHDRYFINSTATRIIELTNQTVVNYIGNYDYYLEKHDILTANLNTAVVTASESDTTSKNDWKLSREEQAKLRKMRNDLKKTEEQINNHEARMSEIDELSASSELCTNTAKLLELHKEREDIENELLDLYEKWESLSENLEKMP